ncbi:YczI family protein [Bacillus sp. S/N-304-OC-R1]|nr:YczI family protein [Bacillus sp. S/N-304-OC-R1]
MLNTLRGIFAVIAFCLAGYSLITSKYQVMPYMLFFLGVMMLCTGISELKVKRKTNAIISFTASVFVLFVSIYTF